MENKPKNFETYSIKDVENVFDVNLETGLTDEEAKALLELLGMPFSK